MKSSKSLSQLLISSGGTCGGHLLPEVVLSNLLVPNYYVLSKK